MEALKGYGAIVAVIGFFVSITAVAVPGLNFIESQVKFYRGAERQGLFLFYWSQ
jgi:hypothetical protein